MVWSEDETLQFGIDKPVLRVPKPHINEQRLLIELKKTTSQTDFLAFAKTLDVSKEDLANFFKKYSAVLKFVETPQNKAKPSIAVVGDQRIERFVAEILIRCGWRVSIGAPKKNLPNQIIIAAERFYPNHLALHRWLFTGYKVLPVLFSDQSVTVGPLISSDEDYENMKPVLDRAHDKDFSKFACQVNHEPVATETAQVITLVSGLILEHLYSSRGSSDFKMMHRIKRNHQKLRVKTHNFR